LKLGWLVLSLSIGLGAYWAKTSWGRYWGWDPVEIVSLVPWFFSTAFFHTITFKKKNANLVKINAILIFLSIVFATLITRGGGLNSLHAFTGENELIIWVIIIGLILLIFSLYVIYEILNHIIEEYKKLKLFLDYISYLFLFLISFVCIFGLFIPPLTFYLSSFLGINPIFLSPDYFIAGSLILAVGLALSLIFCALWDVYNLRSIGIVIVIGMVIQSIFSFIILILLGVWINPFIIIFFISFFASVLKLLKNLKIISNYRQYFRLTSKLYVHAGISLILIGAVIDPDALIFLDIFFISGFILLLIGIIPSILMLFFSKKGN